MLTGRERERKILENTLRDDYSHFAAVYGRRRIGKTFLVRETFGYRFTFQHAGLAGGSMKEQIEAFEHSIRDAGGSAAVKRRKWLEAFEDLKELIRNSSEKKKVIFIDELSWMDTPNCDLLTALESFWNGWASARRDVVLIVCASATSWMLSKVIHNKGGLYNRLTERIELKPFTLAECEEYIKSEGLALNRDQILQYYMIFGGVPYYWTFLEKGLSLAQNVDRVLFANDAPLKDEFKYLYASIFRKPEPYLKIIRALGKKRAGMTREEIISESGLTNSGGLTTRIQELESCGFIRRYNAYGMKKKNAVYQLMDCFTLFYYQFLESRPDDEHFWSSRLNTPEVNAWKGLAFERVCLHHISQIKEKLGISGVSTQTNSWYAKADPERGIMGSQIDLLIVRKDQVISLCEMKYSGSEYTINRKDDESLRRKINDLVTATGTRYAIYPTLITTYGLVSNLYLGEIQSVVTMDDLFRTQINTVF